MKIHIPEFKAMAKRNEHLNHGPIDIDLGPDVIQVIRCKDCIHNVANMEKDPLDETDYTDIVCGYFMTDGMEATDYCSRGKRKNDGQI